MAFPNLGLISYWKLEEASGTRDDAHGPNNLTSVNSVGQGTGIIGNCASFATASERYLNITDAAQTGLDITGSFSISLWAKFTSAPGNPEARFLISKWVDTSAGSTTQGYRFFWFNDGTNHLRIQNSTLGTDTGTFDYDNAAPSLNTWYHYVFVFNAAASLGSRGTLYINGSAITPTSDGLLGSVFNNAQDFRIGGNNPSSTTTDMDGLIDEVGIWNRTLSAAEVTALYNSGAGLALAYTFPEAVTTSEPVQTNLISRFTSLLDTITSTDIVTTLSTKWRNFTKNVATWLNQTKQS